MPMAVIEILGSGRIDERESAFPMAVQLPGGDLLCSFGVGGGALVTGHTEWARSTDRGENWSIEGVILPLDEERGRANFLKLTLSEDRQQVYAYGAWIDSNTDEQFGKRDSRALLCRSLDGGHCWTETGEVPFPEDCPLEVSHGLLALEGGRLEAEDVRKFERLDVIHVDLDVARFVIPHAVVQEGKPDRIDARRQSAGGVSQ